MEKLLLLIGLWSARIRNYYSKGCFKFAEHFLRMTFPVDSEDTTLISGQIGGVLQFVELTQRQNQVLNNIKEDSTISRPTKAKQLNSNKSAVLKHLEIVI